MNIFKTLIMTFLAFCFFNDASGQSLMVFSKTNGYHHANIPDGQSALKQMADREGFDIYFTEDSADFNKKNLKNFDLIIFLQTSGDILNEDQQRAFERYIEKGGSFVGIHSASATEYDWGWYGNMVGNVFDNHPKQQSAKILNLAPDHPITIETPLEWFHYDEWYNFKGDFSEDFTYLLAVDQKSYTGGKHPEFHPVAWCREIGKSRIFYTALGHTSEAFSDHTYLDHLRKGILWTLGN